MAGAPQHLAQVIRLGEAFAGKIDLPEVLAMRGATPGPTSASKKKKQAK
jgi:hypothetical protein